MSVLDDQNQPQFFNGAVAKGLIMLMATLFLGAAALVGSSPETQASACAWQLNSNTPHDPSHFGNEVKTSTPLSIEMKDCNHT